MLRRKYKLEEIVAKLRQGDVLLSQGRPVAETIRAIGASDVEINPLWSEAKAISLTSSSKGPTRIRRGFIIRQRRRKRRSSQARAQAGSDLPSRKNRTIAAEASGPRGSV